MINADNRLENPVDPSRDHILGPSKATVTLVEYGDFQCPFCASAHEVLQEIFNQVEDQVRFVFRQFPLSKIHPFATAAAKAAEAAGRQNRFWGMHDMLFENQKALKPENIYHYARLLKLDLKRFEADFDSKEVASKIQDDFLGGVRSGVNGTPSFYINGSKFEGDWAGGELLSDLESELHHRAAS